MEAATKAAAAAAGRIFVRYGKEAGKRFPGLFKGTTTEDLKSAKKRVEDTVEILTGNKDKDGPAAADRRLPLSLGMEPNPEAPHGPGFSLDADALPLGFRLPIFFGGQPSAASSSPDGASDLMALFGCKQIPVKPIRRRISREEFMSSYQSAGRRLILVGCEGALMVTKGLSLIDPLLPDDEWSLVLTNLCADARNKVFAVTRHRPQRDPPCENLGITAEYGYFTRWNRHSAWEHRKGQGTTIQRITEAMAARQGTPEFIFCIAAPQNTIRAPAATAVNTIRAPAATADIFSCTA